MNKIIGKKILSIALVTTFMCSASFATPGQGKRMKFPLLYPKTSV